MAWTRSQPYTRDDNSVRNKIGESSRFLADRSKISIVAKRMLHDLFGPGFSDTSPESRRRSDSLRDGL